jgi:hypothetical protein
VALFGHLLGVLLLASGVVITLSGVVRAQRATNVAGLRAALAGGPVAGRLIPPGIVLILVCGLYMWSRHGDDHSIAWTAPWLITAVVVFVVMSVLGPAVEEGRSKRIAAAAQAAPEGPITGELDRLRHDRVLHHVSFFGSAQIVALLFLMSVQPALVGSLLAIAIATVLSQLLALLLYAGGRHTAGAPDAIGAPAADVAETR